MKKSRLLEIIQEEIQNVLNEAEDPIQTAFDTRLNLPKPSGVKNIMRPKLIDIWFTDNRRYYKTLVDGEKRNQAETEDLIKYFTGMDIGLRMMDSEVLTQVKDKLKEKNIDLTWDDSFDAS
jgi:hypothetical protein